MRKSILFFAVIVNVLVWGQGVFEYKKDWATYYGPVGCSIHSQLMLDTHSNPFISGEVDRTIYNYYIDYYEQFLVGNKQYNIPVIGNMSYKAQFAPNGILENYELTGSDCATKETKKQLVHIDNQNNKFVIYTTDKPNFLPETTTTGSWYYNNPHFNTNNYASFMMLAKYSETGSLIFCTYIPDNCFVKTDNDGNVYLLGSTYYKTITPTSGSFQNSFHDVIDSNGNSERNLFFTKLNPNGGLLWSSYVPVSFVYDMEVYNNEVYFLFSNPLEGAPQPIVTNNAFQTSPSTFGIMKFNGADGSRLWSTFYGPNRDQSYTISDLKVNENGMFLSGTDYIVSNANHTNFFATSGSYRETVSGGSDLFVSKFTHDGSRVWSTYFGTSAKDANEYGGNSLALMGDDIFITGTAYGSHSSIATIGSYQETPEINNNLNHYFAKLNKKGFPIWCSYYGGTSSYYWDVRMNIEVKNKNLYLYGITNSNQQFSSVYSWQPNIIYPMNSPQRGQVSFLAKFSMEDKSPLPIASDAFDLQLVDNPNNGNFSLIGTTLQQENLKMKIYDRAGRLIFTSDLNNDFKQQFSMNSQLIKGVYIISVTRLNDKNLKIFKMIVQ
ncbi:MAG: T9SS type A sorting domain-containing protein [Bacteroidetes bacterium]|nr:T9SS type A sorting domain-containing protein [Bacteroidota bacterium]